ncbi:hypothetical protein FX988_01408 [Paraglaciecola mesophila]|uniref:Uncharacterized protein n=1 Tax=Paraglaciecola mesophila TaxID=197222 RepID=A0A857JJ46_9ALTE|nr:hypothetical protein [Paraglaciecola mesophila]QHJ11180.1 hypothetical protein FX988_01408 [Paraglaciecola mesophila]
MPHSKKPLLALSRCTSLLMLLGGIFSSVNAFGVDEEFISYDQNEIAVVIAQQEVATWPIVFKKMMQLEKGSPKRREH